MEGQSGQSDFLSTYKTISGKLKKRFLRKPNIAEASDEFRQLVKRQEHDYPHYAAYSCLAMARCEHTLGNPQGEVQALTYAARSFLKAENNNKTMMNPGVEENLTAAINCYSHAIRVHTEQKQLPLAAALCRELGNALHDLGKHQEAISPYQKAAELQKQCPLDCLTSLGLMANCQISVKDYDGALAVMTEMTQIVKDRGGGSNGKPIGAYADIMAECEITRILLLMLLQPTPQRTQPLHAQLLEKYAWDNMEDAAPSFLDENLFLLLQSLVMAVQSRDIVSLKLLQSDLQYYLSVVQNELLYKLVCEMTSPSREVI